MAAKRTGISRDLVIHPGETILDVLNERGITQSELAKRTGMSAPYISNVISGEKDISAGLAMALEYALGVPKSFWLNLQANYDAELLELNEIESVTDEEIALLADLSVVFSWLRKTFNLPKRSDKKQKVLYLRKSLRISSLSILNEPIANGVFRISARAKVNPVVLNAWIRMCQVIGETNTQRKIAFDTSKINDLIFDLKEVMTAEQDDVQNALIEAFSKYGIGFSIVPNFKGAPVQGYIAQDKDGVYQMTATLRGAWADIFWFSIFHEVGHIANGDIQKSRKFIDVANQDGEKREIEADRFARDALLEPKSYKSFLEAKDFSFPAIEKYARSQYVAPFIVIGRLHKEGVIPYKQYANHKVLYKWASNDQTNV